MSVAYTRCRSASCWFCCFLLPLLLLLLLPPVDATASGGSSSTYSKRAACSFARMRAFHTGKFRPSNGRTYCAPGRSSPIPVVDLGESAILARPRDRPCVRLLRSFAGASCAGR